MAFPDGKRPFWWHSDVFTRNPHGLGHLPHRISLARSVRFSRFWCCMSYEGSWTCSYHQNPETTFFPFSKLHCSKFIAFAAVCGCIKKQPIMWNNSSTLSTIFEILMLCSLRRYVKLFPRSKFWETRNFIFQYFVMSIILDDFAFKRSKMNQCGYFSNQGNS